MRIENLNRFEQNGRVGVAATVVWEALDRPSQRIFIETLPRFAADIIPNPDAFVVGCIVPALYLQERRLRIDGAVCPFLREGLDLVMALMNQWSGGSCQPLDIEAEQRATPLNPHSKRRAGLFFSGGFDSLAALRINHLAFPCGHPGTIRDCFLVHGFDIGGVIRRGQKYDVFDRALQRLEPVARDAGVTMIPVYTNIRHLCDERDLWLDKFFGAVLAAVAHAFAPRSHLMYIASSYDLPNIHPCGSHPLLDPAYSSHEMRIQHRDLALSRVDKLKIVAAWDAAFQNFRVCLANVKDRLNCGRCEKCVRTMVGLEAIGMLDKTRAFVQNQISPDLLSRFDIRIRVREPFYRELLPLLRKRGRLDLAETIEKMLS